MSHVERLDFQPVILIGAARSGTNMLRDALLCGPGVATWPCDEINYIWRHFHASSPSDEFSPEQATPRVVAFLRRAFAQQARRTGARWLVEKTCANSLRVDFVRAVFPEAKFLFLVRDGRDVVASALKRWKAPLDLAYIARKARFVPPSDLPYYAVRYLRHRIHRQLSGEKRLGSWGPRFAGMDDMLAGRSLAEVCAEQWRRSVLSAARSFSHQSHTEVCRLRYEHFATHPNAELERAWEFLGVPFTQPQLERAVSGISRGSIGKWQRDADAPHVQAIEPVVDQTLEELVAIDPTYRRFTSYREAA